MKSFAFISSFLLLFGLMFETSAQSNFVHKVLVKEVLQTSNYTYLLVEEDAVEEWLAVPKVEASNGDTIFYKGGMLMTHFESRELKRTFNRVIFLERIGFSAEALMHANMPMSHHSSTKPKAEKLDTVIDPAEGGITVAELINNKEKYAGQTVIIRGQITKFNSQILGTNWAHLQDGTSSGKAYDLTVTTNAQLTVGEIVTFQGIVTLDKDFGSGYFFKIILEDANVIH